MQRRQTAAPPPLTEMREEAMELCLARIRMVAPDKRKAAAEAILALAEPEWWERRRKGSEVFLLILEQRKDAVLKILKEAGAG